MKFEEALNETSQVEYSIDEIVNIWKKVIEDNVRFKVVKIDNEDWTLQLKYRNLTFSFKLHSKFSGSEDSVSVIDENCLKSQLFKFVTLQCGLSQYENIFTKCKSNDIKSLIEYTKHVLNTPNQDILLDNLSEQRQLHYWNYETKLYFNPDFIREFDEKFKVYNKKVIQLETFNCRGWDKQLMIKDVKDNINEFLLENEENLIQVYPLQFHEDTCVGSVLYYKMV